MPIYRLGPDPIFPDPNEAEDGLIAVGGDLSPERLLNAYVDFALENPDFLRGAMLFVRPIEDLGMSMAMR